MHREELLESLKRRRLDPRVLAAVADVPREAFVPPNLADRAYEDDGTLVPRSQEGAVIHDADEIARRTVRMVREGVIDSRNGVAIPIVADTVLLHGDTPSAVELSRRVRSELENAGVTIEPLTADSLRR